MVAYSVYEIVVLLVSGSHIVHTMQHEREREEHRYTRTDTVVLVHASAVYSSREGTTME
jgi:hypothetical protein